MRFLSRERLSCLFLVLFIGNEVSVAQLSAPIASDDHVSVDGNKFLQRTAENDGSSYEQEEEPRNICPQNVQLRWMSEVSSSIYATPLITDLYSDGRKDIIVPAFVHYLEALEGADGAKAVGWPAFHKSTQHSSPLLYDIDVDGVRDILVATYDGEVMFFKDTGEAMSEVLRIPRLKVKRYWYKDLVDGGIDHSHPDVGSEDEHTSSLYSTFMQHDGTDGHLSHLGSPHASPRGAHRGTPLDDGGAQTTQGAAPKLDKGKTDAGGAVVSPVLVTPSPQLDAGAVVASPVQAAAASPQLATVGVPLGGAGQGADDAKVQVAEAQLQAEVLAYVKQLEDVRLSGGDAGVKAMLESLHQSNPTLFQAVTHSARMVEDVKRWKAEQPPQAQQAQAAGTTPPSPAATTTRRRLMSVDEGSDAGELVAPKRKLQAARITSRGGLGGSQQAAGEQGAQGADQQQQQQATTVPTDGSITADQAAVDEQHEVGAELDGQLTDEASESFHVFDGDYDFLHHMGNLSDTDHLNFTEHYDDQAYHSRYEQDEPDLELLKQYGGNLTAYHEARQAAHQALIDHGELSQDSPGLGLDGHERWREEHSGGHGHDYHLDEAHVEHLDDLGAYDVYDEFGEKMGHGVIEEEAQRLGSSPQEHDGFEQAPPDMPSFEVDPELYREHERYDHTFTDDYHDNHPWQYEKMRQQWQDENYKQGAHKYEQQEVFVDAHVLTTPVIGDIDGDGHEELVVAVSYYYDREYYDSAEHKDELQGADPSKYIAGGIVVFDLRTRLLKWSQHLDLSTETTSFKAYIYSAPTLVDLDGDGKMEIVVGTSIGFLYVLDHKGQPREGWPIQMGEIQGQVLVADVNSDGEMEIFAADSRGSIALFTIDGKEIWERHIKTLISQGGTAGDVDGDGELEIVFGTTSGHIYAVRGASGKDAPGFPFRTHGRIQSQVMITRLGSTRSQQLVVMSFDGFLYIVDGESACADTVDIGESSYSMVLADDIDSNGKLDLLVSTMNGNIYMFETYGDFHPLKTWTSQGANNQVARHDYFGIYAVKSSRAPRDVMGDRLAIKFTIIDKRRIYLKNGTVATGQGPYNVSVVLKGVGVIEMKAGAQPVIGVVDTLPKAGTYLMEIPCPRTRSTATIRLELTDGHRNQLSDEFSLSFHIHFYKLLKWLVALPLLAMAAVVMLLTKTRQEEGMALPS